VEIDLILEFGQKLIPIEIKSSSKVEPSTIHSLKSFMESISKIKKVPFGIILYGGDKILEMSKNIYLIPISCIL
jgi:predicted AAA+ superfamily ATPase